MSGRPSVPIDLIRGFWGRIRAGDSIEDAATLVGMSVTQARRTFRKAGGVNQFPASPLKGRYLSWLEREEIHDLTARGEGVRKIARALGRDPATISRELARGMTNRRGYRPSVAQHKANAARRGPRSAKLAVNGRLREEVQRRLHRRESPEQIAGRLRTDFPDDAEMRVSHETIYQALYVQSRGGLNRELATHLRTGRSMRKPRRAEGERRGRIPDMVMISERPAEAEDRAVPGHWEGDLILGSVASGSAIGTLVERSTGFVMLLHLPENHTALAVQEAMIEKISQLPEHLKRSLTWDQGSEMASHKAITAATGLDIYFCDPHSPWQRGSNENTNGLLRQYFPKGTDLSVHGPGILDNVAAELNCRPRKRYDWETPAERLDKLLSNPHTNTGVA
ncbi:IS30 family transposase [Mycetocola manganoxydans]|uniref:IS30 family transposase n=1 Tax=Mycetocola manganoxydans TaxID=699879 RepID=A0A3L6ZW58_9MICO|nr:IS30 family transposase [Mycetocola manganoxydans]RLP71332.1 IS30 family transposase [Mycetocola manganoxydans]GHD45847.1 IS30 family transposase [Mycetocola manganoxydans]